MAAGGDTALQARAPNTKERLMAAAREIMIERNAVEFSLQDVAARSGLNSALVKYHFGNKDGLLLAILEVDAEQSLKQVERLLAREMPATKKLSAHMSGIIETYFRKPYMNRLVHMMIHERDDEAAAAVLRFFVEPLARFQRAILEQGVKSGEFKEVDPGFFYHAVGSACDALFRWHPESRRIWGVATINDAQRRRYADFVVDLVLNGLVKRE
ncbi:MAG: TetR family transcriptional regulator [Hyphomicrobiales bacterium]|nr:TetR family transcriptional regulator [Hyphomicrobiales bacterium]